MGDALFVGGNRNVAMRYIKMVSRSGERNSQTFGWRSKGGSEECVYGSDLKADGVRSEGRADGIMKGAQRLQAATATGTGMIISPLWAGCRMQDERWPRRGCAADQSKGLLTCTTPPSDSQHRRHGDSSIAEVLPGGCPVGL